jgi:hypothetical protein
METRVKYCVNLSVARRRPAENSAPLRKATSLLQAQYLSASVVIFAEHFSTTAAQRNTEKKFNQGLFGQSPSSRRHPKRGFALARYEWR